jgi:catechol 2,3-dioxygenase-like lactoylglutathione lyase family enzyme
MKLEFLYMPTRDLNAALALYRDRLGWQEAWREGDATVSLNLPGTDVQLMLDQTESAGAAGPMFVVDSVAQFNAERPSGLRVREEPEEIPGGFIASFEDASANVIYVLDQSRDTAGVESPERGG